MTLAASAKLCRAAAAACYSKAHQPSQPTNAMPRATPSTMPIRALSIMRCARSAGGVGGSMRRRRGRSRHMDQPFMDDLKDTTMAPSVSRQSAIIPVKTA